MVRKFLVPLLVFLLGAVIVAASSAVVSVQVLKAKQLSFEEKMSSFDYKQGEMTNILVEMRTDIRWIKEKISD